MRTCPSTRIRMILCIVIALTLEIGVCTAQLVDMDGDTTDGSGIAIADSVVDLTADGLRIGNTADGTMNVTGGLEIRNNGADATETHSYLGYSAGTTGTATISGAGSHLRNDFSLTVGNQGHGELNILNGGLVTNVNGQVVGPADGGVVGSGDVTVFGADSHWNNSNNLFLGIFGDATLNVESGGLVTSSGALLGLNTGSNGTATVQNGGRWNNSGDMNVGFFFENSSGTLNIDSSGEVTVGGTMTLRDQGTVNLMGGKLDVATLDLSSGVAATEEFKMTGGGLVVDLILGDFEQAGGTLMPGDSPGFTDMQNDYDMIAGVIEFEIGGLSRATAALTPGDLNAYDAIDVGGIATLNGTVDINFINGFTGSLGDTFQLVNAVNPGGSSGEILGGQLFDFSGATFDMGSGLAWDISQFSNNGSIVIVSAVPEPNSLVMFGIACFSLTKRRRKSNGIA